MKIFDKEYTPKFTLRSLFAFEQIAGKAFEIKNLFDFYIYFYSCLLANKENPSLDFDAFIDWCDEHPEVIEEFNKALEADRKMKNLFEGEDVKKK